MMLIKIEDVCIRPDMGEENLLKVIGDTFRIRVGSIEILKKSLDARHKDNIRYRYQVAVSVNEKDAATLLSAHKNISIYSPPEAQVIKNVSPGLKVSIVGTGPAGLFCALRLIEAGAEVEIFERGKPVLDRMADIHNLETSGILNPESNVLFGEGGAGTYSDGKLTTRTSRPQINWVFEKFVEFGASPEILYAAKPHIGTDRLRGIVVNIRKHICGHGHIFFNKKMTSFETVKGRIASVFTEEDEHPCNHLVLATGHSARDIYELLHEKGVALEKKGFAVGVRVEHPASLIRKIQYGRSEYSDILPPPDYRLTCKSPSGRGVYSFCMCPGGYVVNSSSEEGKLCVNGMSFSRRDARFSNAAIVVTVRPEDMEGSVLAGIRFQREIEESAFKTSKESFHAPAQRVTSFLKGRTDSRIPEVSFKPGVTPADLNSYLPAWISEDLKHAFAAFDRKMNGFAGQDAVMIGAETRTSSPVRILRDPQTLESLSIKNLYPAGEGAGYAGGIVSSAVDGVRIADRIIARHL